MCIYLSPTAVNVLIIWIILFTANCIYFYVIKRQSEYDKFRFFNFITRTLLLILLLFYYLHLPFKEYLRYTVYLSAILLLFLETYSIARNRWKKYNKYYWFDNLLNIILVLIFIGT